MMSLVAIVIGVLIGRVGLSPSLAVVIGMLTGLAAGLFNGLLVSVGKILPLIVTLAGMYIYRSLALIIAVDPQFGPNPMPVSNFPKSFYFIGQYRICLLYTSRCV